MSHFRMYVLDMHAIVSLIFPTHLGMRLVAPVSPRALCEEEHPHTHPAVGAVPVPMQPTSEAAPGEAAPTPQWLLNRQQVAAIA